MRTIIFFMLTCTLASCVHIKTPEINPVINTTHVVSDHEFALYQMAQTLLPQVIELLRKNGVWPTDSAEVVRVTTEYTDLIIQMLNSGACDSDILEVFKAVR